MEEALRDNSATCGARWLLPTAPSSLPRALPTPGTGFPCRAGSAPSAGVVCGCCGEGGRCVWMVFLSEGAVTHWQMEPSPVLLPVSKANPGQCSQGCGDRSTLRPPFFRNPGRAGTQNVTWHCPQGHGCRGLSVRTQTGSNPEFLQAGNICFRKRCN